MFVDTVGNGKELPRRPPRTPGMWSPSDEAYAMQKKGWCNHDCVDTEFVDGEPCDSCNFKPQEVKK